MLTLQTCWDVRVTSSATPPGPHMVSEQNLHIHYSRASIVVASARTCSALMLCLETKTSFVFGNHRRPCWARKFERAAANHTERKERHKSLGSRQEHNTKTTHQKHLTLSQITRRLRVWSNAFLRKCIRRGRTPSKSNICRHTSPFFQSPHHSPRSRRPTNYPWARVHLSHEW